MYLSKLGDAYAELARQTGRERQAIRAYRKLIESGAAEERHYTALSELLERDAPREAAALAAQGYLRFGNPYLARRAMYLYQRAGDAAATRAFLAGLTDAQRSALAQDAHFLYQPIAARPRSRLPPLLHRGACETV